MGDRNRAPNRRQARRTARVVALLSAGALATLLAVDPGRGPEQEEAGVEGRAPTGSSVHPPGAGSRGGSRRWPSDAEADRDAVRILPRPAATAPLPPGVGVRRGRTGAPTLLVVTDYQCGACAALEAALGDTLFAWAAAGRMGLVVIPAPLPGHRRGRMAAAVARCAERAGRFEAVHAALFRERRRWVTRPGSAAALEAIAAAEGFDAGALRHCREAEKTRAVLAADSLAGAALASVRPALFLEGSRLRAARPSALLSFLRSRLPAGAGPALAPPPSP